MTAERTRGSVAVDGVELHYVEAGDGPLIVLVHGFPSCAASFRFQIEEFARDHRVVAIDALGAGRSSRPHELDAYRIERLVVQLDGFGRAVGGHERFTLVGHDWGGALAWTYAQVYPERLSGLVSIAAPPYNQLIQLLQNSVAQRERSSYMWSMRDGVQHRFMVGNDGWDLWEYIGAPLRALPHVDGDLEREFRAAYAVPGAIDAGIDWYRANIPDVDDLAGSEPWPSRHARTPVPALQIWGDADETFVPEFLDGLDRYADEVTVHRMAEVGHWPMIERPDEVNQVIGAFLERTVTSR